jgi:hypothetical protein
VLADLEARLREITSAGHADLLKKTMAGVGIAIHLAGGMHAAERERIPAHRRLLDWLRLRTLPADRAAGGDVARRSRQP